MQSTSHLVSSYDPLLEKKAASKCLRHVGDLANINRHMAGIFVFLYVDSILIL